MMTPYCTPCIYCRYLGGSDRFCAYYLDTRKKLPCPGGDDCTARLILTGEDRERYLAKHCDAQPYPPKVQRDWHLDDFIVDSRGIVGEYPGGNDHGR